jgi:MerR family transcriptional regulator, copper efflux regulator
MNAAALAWPVNIGMASRMSGVTPKMIRHYETLGLVPAVGRTDSGYRQYSEADVHTLRFIKRSRELGFPIADIGELVSLWRNRRRASSSVRRIAQQHAQELAQRIQAMQAMQRTLDQLIYCCQGDERPDCPILDDLAGLHDGVHA